MTTILESAIIRVTESQEQGIVDSLNQAGLRELIVGRDKDILYKLVVNPSAVWDSTVLRIFKRLSSSESDKWEEVSEKAERATIVSYLYETSLYVTPGGGGTLTPSGGLIFLTTTPLVAGATYETEIVSIETSSQVQTEVLSDTDGTLQFIFHANSAGTQIVRQLSVPYFASEGYRLFAAPAFSPHVQYKFVNSGSPQSSFYFRTRQLVESISPQSLAVDAFVSPAMVANLQRSILVGATPGDQYKNVKIDESSRLNVSIGEPVTAFGEVRTAESSPLIQIDAVDGILDEQVETFVDTSPGTGSASALNGNFVCKTGVGVGGYGVIRSQRVARYRAGQGLTFRYTAGFTSPVANSLQIAGAFSATNGFVVGYDGTQLGVMHRYDGLHEVRTLTLTAGAAGAETISLTLNNVLYSIPVTAGDEQHVANEIEEWMVANQSVWSAYQSEGTVVFLGQSPGPLSNTYSISSTGTVTGNFVQDTAGVVPTEDWVYQADWDDPLDGTGPSGMTMDPTKGNVFEISMQYLGYGNVKIRIENPLTGKFFTFYEHVFANSRMTPTLNNPTLKIGWAAASLGSTTDLTVFGASGYAAVDGKLHPTKRPRGFSHQQTSVSGTLKPIFSIRVRGEFKGKVQLSEIFPKIAYFSPEGTKAAEIVVLLNPTFSATHPHWQYFKKDVSYIDIDTNAVGYTDLGNQVAAFTVNGGGTREFNFQGLGEGGINPLHLGRGDVLSFAARINGGGGNNVTGSLTWLPD